MFESLTKLNCQMRTIVLNINGLNPVPVPITCIYRGYCFILFLFVGIKVVHMIPVMIV